MNILKMIMFVVEPHMVASDEEHLLEICCQAARENNQASPTK